MGLQKSRGKIQSGKKYFFKSPDQQSRDFGLIQRSNLGLIDEIKVTKVQKKIF